MMSLSGEALLLNRHNFLGVIFQMRVLLPMEYRVCRRQLHGIQELTDHRPPQFQPGIFPMARFFPP